MREITAVEGEERLERANYFLQRISSNLQSQLSSLEDRIFKIVTHQGGSTPTFLTI